LVLEKEKRKRELLKKDEETWRQKSMINWLASETRIQSFFMPLQNIENRPMPSGILKVGWIPNYKPTRF
jgi:hypothetical protein